MCRTSRNNALCFENLEETLAQNTKAYGHIDLIAFGFPCQDISQANSKGQGLKGKRSSLFFECMRIVNIFNPAWLLIENVPRLLSINEGYDMAVILQTLAESGYGWAYRLLDSQYFGVPQRRKRVFIVGCLGKMCPPEILFESQGSGGNDKKKQEMGKRGLCLSTRDEGKQDPTAETFIASTVRATTVRTQEAGNRICGLVAQTINTGKRGCAGRIWEDTHIAEINADRKRKASRISGKLDSCRGIVLGNAVTVNIAEWIGRRIINYGGEK